MKRFALLLVLLLMGCSRGCEKKQPPLASTDDPYGDLERLLRAGSPKARWHDCGDCLDEPAFLFGPTEPSPQDVEAPFVPRPAMAYTSDEAKAFVAHHRDIAAIAARLRTVDARTTPERAVLLQHDVWAAFDAVHALDETPREETLKALAGVIVALALPRADLVAMGPTLGSALPAHPELFDRATMDDLVEIAADESEPPMARPRLLTTHARLRDLRSVFHRFVRVPGGVEALRALVAGTPSSIKLPEGSIAIIVEAPLAISKEGELVASKRVTLVEIRRVVRLLPPSPKVRDLAFDVLEGPRLEPIAPGAPFPSLGSCGVSQALAPMRKTCVLCHQASGDTVRSFSHGKASFHLVDSSDVTEAALQAKSARPEMKTLKRYL